MASLEIVTVPCRSDNYAYLLRDASGAVAVVDAPETAPIVAALEERGWGLDWIWLTHHHADHVAGVADLVARYGCKVAGARADAERLPKLDRMLGEGETVALGEAQAAVIDVSGHTVNHIAYHFPEAKAVFTGDSLFVLGCGRVFEGTHAMMWASLSKLARLDPATTVWCGHEYTLGNLAFARAVEPGNAKLAEQGAEYEQARAEGRPTVPTTIGRELAANPFLRAKEPSLQAALGLSGADAAAVFAEARRRKDAF
ncbi:MAG: hydroxyacylglutathione hydrolase [Rhodobacteraceae bacterium]|nr:MAG: hydroxyacylglutathione hydrolase [Paracoccaceae bacterium]